MLVECQIRVSEMPQTVSVPCVGHRGEGGSETKNSHKTVNIFLGYFFMVNFCLGTGFLGVPFSFFYSGYLAAVPTLILASFVTWLTSTWLLEVMARAQVTYCRSTSVAVWCIPAPLVFVQA